MSVFKKLASQTALYGLSSILGRMVNFLLVPFYTELIAPEEYGVVTELYAYIAVFNIIYTYGLETAFFRFASAKDADVLKVFRVVQTMLLLTSFVFSALIILNVNSIQYFLEYQGYENTIYFIALLLFTDTLVAIPFAYLRQQGKAFKFAVSKLVNIGLNIAFNLVLILGCQQWSFVEGSWLCANYNPVAFIFVANLLANALFFVMLYKEVSLFRFEFSWELMKLYLNYAYPLLFMQLAGVLNEMLDRMILKSLLPEGFYTYSKKTALGVYGACYKLSMFMTLGIQSFRYAAEPFFFAQAQDKKAPALFAKVMTGFVLTCLTVFVLISLLIEPIGWLFVRNEVLRTGLFIVPILLMANMFLGIYFNLSVWYKVTDRTYWGTYIAVFGAIITVVGNVVTIPIIGFVGSAWTTFACYFIMSAVSYSIGSKYFKIPYDLKVILGMSIYAVFVVMLHKYIFVEKGWWIYIGGAALGFLIWTLPVYWVAKKKLLNT